MIKALALTQPWASLIAYGGKRIETRSWLTKYRGWVLIHASQVMPPEARDLMDRDPFRRVFSQHGVTKDNATHNTLPRGAVCAVARLADCVPTALLGPGKGIQTGRQTWTVTDQELAFGDYGMGRWAWLLADVTRLTWPVQARGRLGLWHPDAAIIAAVERDLLGLASHGCAQWHDVPTDWPKDYPKDVARA